MTNPRFSSLFLRLSRDAEARKAFVADPSGFVRKEGIDPESLDLPRKIDADTLEEKIKTAFGNGNPDWQIEAAEAASLNAEDLWSRFGVIAERAGADDDKSVATTVATAVVVYGTSVVTAEGASVAFERARTLRGIAGLRKSDLSFTVTRPDGLAVDNLPANAVETLLRRMR